MPSARTIRNYVALVKSIGLKFVAKPQLRDLKVHVNRCSFRNACTIPLPMNDSRNKCEFGAVPCGSASMSETIRCASRRCTEHSKRNYVCNCWQM